MTGIVALLCRCGFDPEYDLTPVRKTVDGLVFVSSNKPQHSDDTGLPGFYATTHTQHALWSIQTPKDLSASGGALSV
jgi:hypothetical protein